MSNKSSAPSSTKVLLTVYAVMTTISYAFFVVMSWSGLTLIKYGGAALMIGMSGGNTTTVASDVQIIESAGDTLVWGGAIFPALIAGIFGVIAVVIGVLIFDFVYKALTNSSASKEATAKKDIVRAIISVWGIMTIAIYCYQVWMSNAAVKFVIAFVPQTTTLVTKASAIFAAKVGIYVGAVPVAFIGGIIATVGIAIVAFALIMLGAKAGEK